MFSPVPGRAASDLYEDLNPVEQRAVDEVLAELGLQLDGEPQGKVFGRLIVVNEEVFGQGSFFRWLDPLHTTTRQAVVQEEAVWQAGEPFDIEDVRDTLRALRQRPIVSVVAMVPVLSDDPLRTTDILVITRDVWTLKPGFDISSSGGDLDYVAVALFEDNLAGRNKIVGINTLWGRDAVGIGPTYDDPHLLGSRLSLFEEFSIILNLDTGRLEGTTNLVTLALPLYRRLSRWGFRVREEHVLDIDRTYQAATLRTYDNPDTVAVEAVPYEVNRQEINAEALAIRAFGQILRHEISFGYGLSYRHYALVADLADPILTEAFEHDVLTGDEFTSYTTVLYRFYRREYATLGDFNTFVLSEDQQVGHDIQAAFDLGTRSLGSDSDFFKGALTLGYNAHANGWVCLGSVQGGARWEMALGEFNDRFVGGNLRLATPYWGPLSLHLSGSATLYSRSRSHARQGLGSATGLRGFPTGFQSGDSMAKAHIELRSAPYELLGTYWGLVLFADVGSAYDEGESPDWLSDTGIGLRLLVPSLQRDLVRLDYAFPLSGGPSPWPGVLTFGFGQAF